VNMPYFLKHTISRLITRFQAKLVWEWLNSNSNTVIVDELMMAVKSRRDFGEIDK
jgi:hypothetical protein